MRIDLRQLPAWAVYSGGAALAVALTWLAYAWVVAPNQQQAHEAESTKTAAAAQHAKARQLESEYARLTQAHAQRLEAIGRLPNKLGDRRALNRKIASLIELAQGRGLEVLQLQPGDTTPGEQYDLTELQLQAAAPFPKHLDFLDALHRSFPDISVVGLELHSRGTGPNPSANPRPQATLSLVWFTAVGDAAGLADAGRDR